MSVPLIVVLASLPLALLRSGSTTASRTHHRRQGAFNVTADPELNVLTWQAGHCIDDTLRTVFQCQIDMTKSGRLLPERVVLLDDQQTEVFGKGLWKDNITITDFEAKIRCIKIYHPYIKKGSDDSVLGGERKDDNAKGTVTQDNAFDVVFGAKDIVKQFKEKPEGTRNKRATSEQVFPYKTVVPFEVMDGGINYTFIEIKFTSHNFIEKFSVNLLGVEALEFDDLINFLT